MFARETSLMPDYAYVYASDNLRRCWGVFNGSTPVAHCAARRGDIHTLGTTIPWAAFGNVATHPDWRGRGLGTRLMTMCLDDLRRAGVEAIYISGGRGLYTRIGAAPAGDLRRVAVRRSAGAVRGLRVLSPSAGATVLARLYDREPVRYLRSTGALAAVLRTGFVQDVPVRTYALGGAAAVIGPVWGTTIARGGTAVALDLAGEPADAVRLLSAIRARLGVQQVIAAIPAWNTLLIAALGSISTPTGVPGTILILDVNRLLARVRPFLPADEFRRAPQHRSHLAPWLFGDGAGTSARVPLPAIGLNYM